MIHAIRFIDPTTPWHFLVETAHTADRSKVPKLFCQSWLQSVPEKSPVRWGQWGPNPQPVNSLHHKHSFGGPKSVFTKAKWTIRVFQTALDYILAVHHCASTWWSALHRVTKVWCGPRSTSRHPNKKIILHVGELRTAESMFQEQLSQYMVSLGGLL